MAVLTLPNRFPVVWRRITETGGGKEFFMKMEIMNMLELRSIRKSFGDVLILNGAELCLEGGNGSSRVISNKENRK